MLLLLILLACAPASIRSGNKSIKMVENLRRQLMEDNYDYLPSEDELTEPVHEPFDHDAPNDELDSGASTGAEFATPAGEETRSATDHPHVGSDIDRVDDRKADYEDSAADEKYRVDSKNSCNDNNKNNNVYGSGPEPAQRGSDEDFVPRARVSAQPESDRDETMKEQDEPPKGHVVSKIDLLYYVDDERLRARPARREDDFEDERADRDSDIDRGARADRDSDIDRGARADRDSDIDRGARADRDSDIDRGARADRDSDIDRGARADAVAGGDATDTTRIKIIKVKSGHGAQRLAQQESAAGVVLMSLDGQPVPQFQLPRARRQYMSDRDSPLSDLHSD